MAEPRAIEAITLKGFKSFADEQQLAIRPLTLLAGANSSGKSSALQPLLLLKQTLEAPYDPGALLLDGPHVQFTAADQVLTQVGGKAPSEELEIFLDAGPYRRLRERFRRNDKNGLDLAETVFTTGRVKRDRGRARDVVLRPETQGKELGDLFVAGDLASYFRGKKATWGVRRDRCFFRVAVDVSQGERESFDFPPLREIDDFAELLLSILHIPGLRGNPVRTYRATAVAKTFVGPFPIYTASIVLSWQQDRDDRLHHLNRELEQLGLTWAVRARQLDATQVELLVGRLPKRSRGGSRDLVNIADVGFGVSQVLPVLVALHAARPGQLVYIEQPEIHLHPRAVEGLAVVLAEAALRDVRVVVETHSSLLLLALQALVAEGKLPPEKVCLHWFRRDARGATRVESSDLDRQGAYGDWPEDFWQVRAGVETRYLDAADAQALADGDDKA
jgi:hypothetical protein